MHKFIIISLAIFEFLFYTVIMVLVGSIPLTSNILKIIIHFVSIITISFILYFLIKLILKKLKMNINKYLYLIPLWNFLIGTIFISLLAAIIPSEKFFYFSFGIIISSVYYGIFINILIVILNFLITKAKN